MKTKLYWSIGAIVIAAVAILPLVSSSRSLVNHTILIVMYVGITVAWNIAAFGGALSLGHAAFFGLGSYTSTLLLLNLGVNPWVGMLAGMAVAAAGGLLLSVPLLRLKGPFFTLASLAFLEVLRLLAVFGRDLTGGSEGLTVPAKEGWLWMSFSERAPYLWIVLGMSTITVLISVWMYHSSMGYKLRALGADEIATRALGVHTGRVKVFALVVSAALTGAFGTFAAQYFYIVDPDTNFSLMTYAVQPALNGIIGGVGTVFGPILGAILMTPIGEMLRSSFSDQQGLAYIIYGAVLIVVVLAMPGGIVSGIKKLRDRFRGSKSRRLSDDKKRDRVEEEEA